MKQIYIMICAVIMALSSCGDDKTIVGDVLLTAYEFEEPEVTATSASQELTFHLSAKKSYELPDDWYFFQVAEWDESLPVDKWLIKNFGTSTGDDVRDLDWVTIEKVKDGKPPMLRVKLKQNEDARPRAIRIIVGYDKSPSTTYSGQIIIWQKAKADKTPFVVKAKYKGQLYVTNAHLNENEELVYDSQDFKNLMDYLASRNNVETIVKDDEVVNYYDEDDMNAVPALRALQKRIDSGRCVGINGDTYFSRAGNAWEHMDQNALGFCVLYDDDNFSDTRTFKNLMDLNSVYDEHYLRDIGLNDKITSLAVAYKGTASDICAVLTVWEDSNYNFGDNDRTKHRVSFVASVDKPLVSRANLKNIPCINSGNSWNDRISSFSFHFGYYGANLKDY